MAKDGRSTDPVSVDGAIGHYSSRGNRRHEETRCRGTIIRSADAGSAGAFRWNRAGIPFAPTPPDTPLKKPAILPSKLLTLAVFLLA